MYIFGFFSILIIANDGSLSYFLDEIKLLINGDYSYYFENSIKDHLIILIANLLIMEISILCAYGAIRNSNLILKKYLIALFSLAIFIVIAILFINIGKYFLID